jgi:hypothetical protein
MPNEVLVNLGGSRPGRVVSLSMTREAARKLAEHLLSLAEQPAV